MRAGRGRGRIHILKDKLTTKAKVDASMPFAEQTPPRRQETPRYVWIYLHVYLHKRVLI